ncbi:hypothetical protein BIV57_18180 [Mangrovactinospora gilvigrisea]|uniref:Uncharacterized protein n=1 Tax=Mangrovactinospora gilvigrisea TaxID=1428644 RepID=A0A1J7C3G8_9ACTN|nr:hypothetical protein [Mangrovactinospora gilvigrisea]OIV36088.1 hypothetical protein BIV57_18180 [Mangrovactinospora gilvigrisea]
MLRDGFNSSDVLGYNDKWLSDTAPRLHATATFTNTPNTLPVFRMADGSSLVACTFTTEMIGRAKAPGAGVAFTNRDAAAQILAGRRGTWTYVDTAGLGFALLTVPPTGPASVATCLCAVPILDRIIKMTPHR